MNQISIPGIVAMLLLGAVVGLGLRSAGSGAPPPPPGNDPAPSPGAETPAPPADLLAGIEGFVDLKNETCPVMGNPVNASDPAYLVYNQVAVRFCCPGCDVTFLEDPLAYLRKLAEQGVEVPSQLLTEEGHPDIVDSKNTVCPIMENEITNRGSAWMVHNGVRVDFCCPPCIEDFARDPVASLRKTARYGNVPEDRIR